MSVAIVIPTYNERENLEALVRKIRQHEPLAKIVIVDDNSPDGTGRIADELAAEDPILHVIHRDGRRGLGSAYIQGFKRALSFEADYIVQMDADLSHDPQYLPVFLQAIRSSDLVVGSRYLHGIRVVNWSLARLTLSVFANWYARTITSLPIQDVTSGFRCWRSWVLRRMDLDTITSSGYAFQIETVYRAYKMGCRIEEVPIIFFDRVQGNSKMSKGVIFEAALIPWRLLLRGIIEKEHKQRSS